jgi:hypothetical protein
MAGDTDNPRIWANAEVYVADVGEVAPTTVSAAWGSGWDDLGLVGEDGISEARSETVTPFRALGGILVRTVKSAHERTFTVTALEDTPQVFDVVNPGSTQSTTTGLTTRVVKVPQANVKAFGIERRDGDVTSRILIPRGEVTAVGDAIVASDSEMAGRELTITVYPAADGTLYTELTDDPQAVVA